MHVFETFSWKFGKTSTYFLKQIYEKLPVGSLPSLRGSSRSSHYRTKRGKIIEDTINQFQLAILNPPEPIFYNFAHETWSMVYLVIAPANLTSSGTAFLHDYPAGNDYVPTITSIAETLRTPLVSLLRWNFHKTE